METPSLATFRGLGLGFGRMAQQEEAVALQNHTSLFSDRYKND
jgi:hypothetical protein